MILCIYGTKKKIMLFAQDTEVLKGKEAIHYLTDYDQLYLIMTSCIKLCAIWDSMWYNQASS